VEKTCGEFTMDPQMSPWRPRPVGDGRTAVDGARSSQSAAVNLLLPGTRHMSGGRRH